MHIHQVKFDLESSKENLLDAILKNRESHDITKINFAIKEFVKNYDNYNLEKMKVLDTLSNDKLSDCS